VYICQFTYTRNRYTGWRRLIGCHQSQVIFRKRAINYRALLRKMIYTDEASYDSTPPCNMHNLIRFILKPNTFGESFNLILQSQSNVYIHTCLFRRVYTVYTCLFWVYTGLFWEYIELFGRYMWHTISIELVSCQRNVPTNN